MLTVGKGVINMGCCKPPNRFIPWFSSWQDFTPVIPKMYWDVESQEQRMHAICEQLHKLACFVDFMGGKVSENRDDIDELQEQFEKFIESGFYDYYADQLEQWINDNLPWLWKTFAKQVFFGLTMDGHFCAYVPESWQDITFDTGMVFGRSDYGRLILRFNADGAINNTYDYSYSDAEALELEQAIADLETIIGRSDLCYDTLFTNLDEEV